MEELLERLARRVQHKYYGKYRGFVVDNADPQKLGRVRLRVPSVLGTTESDWALPCLAFGGLADQGLFTVPEVGAQVWVEFEEGELSQPIWVGTFWQTTDDVPEEAALDEPTTRLFKTPSGHILEFDDKSGEERVYLYHSAGAEMEIDEKGTVALTDAKGAKLTLDADAGEIVVEDANGNTMTMSASGTTVEDGNGNKIEMAAAGVTVKGTKVVVEGNQVMLAGQGGEPIIKGQSFLTLFMTHVHPTAMGPSGPPIPQGEMSTLSMKVLTS
jgi:uncharacterized protein involved in type VI secretion and phage assembly